MTTETTSQSNYASFGRRFLAYSVDGLILSIASMFLSVPLSMGNSALLAWVPGIILNLAYFTYFWVKQDGQTLGNRLLAIKVVKEAGGKISLGDSVLRYLGYMLSGAVLLLGFLWALWDGKKQGWHDKIARTVVVRTKEKGHVILAAFIVFGSWLLATLVIAGLVIAFAVVLSQSGGRDVISLLRNVENIEGLNSSEFKKGITEIEQKYSSNRNEEVLNLLNKYRQESGFPILVSDSRLCAYAQRRLEQLVDFGKLDDHKGFYEDQANSQVKQAYFADFTHVSETYHYEAEYDDIDTSEQLVSSWAPNNEIMRNKTYNFGCVRSNNDFLIVVAATDLKQ